jgi:pimeloyl-ACP methyl ester carboxylesterase
VPLILAAAFWGTKFAALSIPPLILRRDKPPVFVSHGTRDGVLPIERCSRRIVAQLDREGYEVRYRELDGPHTVPEPVVHKEALGWFTTGRGTTNVALRQGNVRITTITVSLVSASRLGAS